jgi:homospermidine synthase
MNMQIGAELARHDRRLVVVGFGIVAATTLTLLIEHLKIQPARICVIYAETEFPGTLHRYPIDIVQVRLTHGNLEPSIMQVARAGDVVLNLASNVSSYDLIMLCRRAGLLYLDTSIESWSECGDVWEQRRSLVAGLRAGGRSASTALICHGANPGLVSHFARQALAMLAARLGCEQPSLANSWSDLAHLAQSIRVATVQIAEVDSQACPEGSSSHDLPANTWCVSGLLGELNDHASWARGTNETMMPLISDEFVRLPLPSHASLVRSWIPTGGPFVGHLVPHPEVFSIADSLTLLGSGATITYRPSVQFVYMPCPSMRTHLGAPQRTNRFEQGQIIASSILEGTDDLGVVILRCGSDELFWYGSSLGIAEARRHVRDANATAVQVSAGVLAGLQWLLANPKAGLVEPEQIDTEQVLNGAARYLGSLYGMAARWPWSRIPPDEGHRKWNYAELAGRPGDLDD